MSVNDKCYILSNKETAVAVLRVVAGSRLEAGPVATRWMNKAFGRTGIKHETQRTREFLHRLRRAELVEGLTGRDGGVRWWKITDTGREFVKTHG